MSDKVIISYTGAMQNPQAPSRMTALVLCGAAAIVDGFDTQSMGVAAPRVVAEFGLSHAQAAVIFSAATFGLFLGAAIGGRAADFAGRKRMLIGSLLMFGVCSLLTSLSTGPYTLFAARLATGLGLGGALPNFISLASESAPSERRLSLVALLMAGMPLGGAIAALIALGAQWGWGWRSIFIVGGMTPIAVALALQFLVQETWRGRSARGSSPAPDAMGTVLFGAARARTTLLLWPAFFFTQLVLHLMLNWLPSLLIGLQFSRSQASWASVVFNLGGVIGACVLGRMHAGEHRRQWVLTTYAGMAIALAAVASVSGTFAWTALACALAGFFTIGAQLILFALAPLYYPTPIRGTGVGAAVAVGRLGSVAGPLFAGALLTLGGGSTAVLLAILPFVAIGGSAAFVLTWRPHSHD